MTPEEYAQAVVQVLREHTSFITRESVAQVISDAVWWQARKPESWFEVTVDSTAVAHWRLVPSAADERHVRLACYRPIQRTEDTQFEDLVNEALAALEAGQ